MVGGIVSGLRRIGALGVCIVGAAGVWTLVNPRSFVWQCAFLASASAAGLATGALGAALVGRRVALRSLRYSRRETIVRGADWGMWMAYAFTAPVFVTDVVPDQLYPGLILGAVVGLGGGLCAWFLSPAESAFARGAAFLREGNTTAARAAIREYVQGAEKDPLRAARLPAAQAFLDGTRETLDLSMELEAAEVPSGRGTEPEAVEAPVGRGTELEAGGRPRCESIARSGSK